MFCYEYKFVLFRPLVLNVSFVRAVSYRLHIFHIITSSLHLSPCAYFAFSQTYTKITSIAASTLTSQPTTTSWHITISHNDRNSRRIRLDNGQLSKNKTHQPIIGPHWPQNQEICRNHARGPQLLPWA